MPEQVFFYGTLRTASTHDTAGVDTFLKFAGAADQRKAIDLGIYPAAVPRAMRAFGEVFEITDPPTVLAALDRIEGHRPAEPERSLYNRVRVSATLDDGRTEDVWVYFYNAPLGRAPRITSGDYVEHLKSR